MIELGKEGASKAEMAAEIGCSPTNAFYAWQEQHSEFREAVKEATALSQAWWEKQGRIATFGGTEGFNATSYIFNMKNRFPADWRDKVEQDLNHGVSDPLMDMLNRIAGQGKRLADDGDAKP